MRKFLSILTFIAIITVLCLVCRVTHAETALEQEMRKQNLVVPPEIEIKLSEYEEILIPWKMIKYKYENTGEIACWTILYLEIMDNDIFFRHLKRTKNLMAQKTIESHYEKQVKAKVVFNADCKIASFSLKQGEMWRTEKFNVIIANTPKLYY